MIKFSILLTNSMRSKAYLQNLLINNLIPASAIILEDKNKVLVEEQNRLTLDKNTSQKLIHTTIGVNAAIDEKKCVEETLKENKIFYHKIDTLDVNSSQVVSAVANLTTEYIIYSGPGGAILKSEIFQQGKKFIHVHPGNIPIYKGSTTYYYEMLIESQISCSIFLMNEQIDSGQLLYKKHFKIPAGYHDFDNVVDPLLRCETLIAWLNHIKNSTIANLPINTESDNTFYIIHPLLKHIAISKARGVHI